MGANKPELPEPEIKTGRSVLLPFVILAAGVLAIALFPKIGFVEEYGSPKLHPKEEEEIKLFNYRYLPENLARPPKEQLPRPPFNPVMR